jgi:uncharacterized protein with HEPN domain
MKRNVRLYLEDIETSIARIIKYTNGFSFSKFNSDRKTIDAVLMNFSVLGEAIKNLPTELKRKYPQIPWRDIIAMRNKIIHEYFGVDEKILWETIKKDVPVLKKQLKVLKS